MFTCDTCETLISDFVLQELKVWLESNDEVVWCFSDGRELCIRDEGWWTGDADTLTYFPMELWLNGYV